MNKKTTIYELVVYALMAALMCIFGPRSLPIGPVPITLTNFVICVAIYLVGVRSTVSTLVYILLGLVGLPVFSGFTGGVGKLLGPTGGYIIGFLFLAAIGGGALELAHSKKMVALFKKCATSKKNERFFVEFFQILITVLGMVMGTAALYAFGTAWFVFQQKTTVEAALSLCVYPFIPLDLIKIAIATVLGRAVRVPLAKAGLLIR